MITHLRRFNELGIERFRTALHEIKSGELDTIPASLVTDAYACEIVNADIKIEQKVFTSKDEIVKYIFEIIAKMPNRNLLYDAGLWSWLSAFYFESVCPERSDGRRKVGEDSRYILNTEWRNYYRHLIASPTRLYKELNELAKIYLAGTPDKNGDLLESLASRQDIATCKGVIEAATVLYWDKEKNKIKVGARNKDGKGVLRRFVGAFVQQFQMTYDLNAMNGNQVIQLLPNEYEGWITL